MAETITQPLSAEAQTVYRMALGAASVYGFLSQRNSRYSNRLWVAHSSVSAYIAPRTQRTLMEIDQFPDIEVRRKKSDGKLLDRPSFMRVRDLEQGLVYNVNFHSEEPFGEPKDIDTVAIDVLGRGSFRTFGRIRPIESLSFKREEDQEKITGLWDERILPLVMEGAAAVAAQIEGEK